jgi:uncharacterized protein (DUF2235 family)
MPKNIVVCYDGTGNEYGRNNTNVVGTFESVLRDEDQVAFYDPGVGTVGFLGRSLGLKVGTWLGKAFGYGLMENVEDGYGYLMDTFVPGDQVYVFGFSRGAFTARTLVGMVYKVGVLQKGSRNLVPYATRTYLTPGNAATAAGFKATYSHDCKVQMVGVWDTVASLGWFFGREFPNARLNPDARFGYHAVAIDEKRRKFPVSLWEETDLPPGQTIEQVWFAGVHANVGGWYDDRGLSDIALAWMLEKAERAGLRLKQDWRSRLRPDPFGMLHESRAGFWKLWRPAPRTIPPGARIHASVYRRMGRLGDYRPAVPPEPPAPRAVA